MEILNTIIAFLALIVSYLSYKKSNSVTTQLAQLKNTFSQIKENAGNNSGNVFQNVTANNNGGAGFHISK